MNENEEDVLYTSKKTKKTYNSMDELKADEAEWEKSHKAELERAKNRKADAAKVDEARNKYQQAIDEFNKIYEEAQVKLNKARHEYFDSLEGFTKKWGSYHYSISNNAFNKEYDDFHDIFNWLLGL